MARPKPKVEPCLKCPLEAKCCNRGVEVNEEQKELIETLNLTIPKPWFTEQWVDWLDESGPNYSSLVTANGCIFLTKDKQCAIHAYCLEHNLDMKQYKPFDCLEYPYVDGEPADNYESLCGVYFGEEVPKKPKAAPLQGILKGLDPENPTLA